jgi:hypothetical protein
LYYVYPNEKLITFYYSFSPCGRGRNDPIRIVEGEGLRFDNKQDISLA